jgi:copper chaperone NosL
VQTAFASCLEGLVKPLVLALLAAIALAACKKEAGKPAPQAVSDAAIDRYSGMMLAEHEGPRGQIFVKGEKDPVWFSSARDTIAFTLLPEEPKDIVAIYVSDMGAAPSWADPGATNWTDAKTASYVIGSDAEGGMGGAEAVPFADKAKAEAFAREHGGKVVGFDAIPPDYILGAHQGSLQMDQPTPTTTTTGNDHDH